MVWEGEGEREGGMVRGMWVIGSGVGREGGCGGEREGGWEGESVWVRGREVGRVCG